MLSFSHIIIIVIAALIFLGPNKIPDFMEKCGEGISLFKNALLNPVLKKKKRKSIKKIKNKVLTKKIKK